MAEKSFDALLYQALLEAGWQENRTTWEGTEEPGLLTPIPPLEDAAAGRPLWLGEETAAAPVGPRPCGQRPASCWPPP